MAVFQLQEAYAWQAESRQIEKATFEELQQAKLPFKAVPGAMAGPLVASLDCNQARFQS